MLHGLIVGQSVPYVKDDMSRDSFFSARYPRGMSIWIDEAQFNDELCARIHRLRLEREWTQQQMAAAIGVPHERYKKYETRSPMPHYLLPRFALVVDRTVAYILTGPRRNRRQRPAQIAPIDGHGRIESETSRQDSAPLRHFSR